MPKDRSQQLQELAERVADALLSGYREGVPLELIWWSRELAESSIDSFFHTDMSSAADAIAHGVALRTSGSLSRWQARLSDYPEGLARARIEDAALTWGGFTPAGLLTLARPGELLSRTERMFDDATRVLRIVYALNRVWQPTHKRLAARVASLEVKPAQLAERIDEAFVGVGSPARTAGHHRTASGHRRPRTGWPEREPGTRVASGGCKAALL